MSISGRTEERSTGTTHLLLTGLLATLVAVPVGAADLAGAKKNYTALCAKCHGAAGKGDGPGAAGLSKRPKNLSDCAAMKTTKDETLFTAIKEGGEAVQLSKDMPPWKEGLDDDEIHDLVAYVRSLCKE